MPMPASAPYMPAPSPAPGRRRLAMILGSVAVVALIVIAALLVVRSRSQSPSIAQVSPSQIEATSAACDSAKNPDGCKAVKLTELAVQAGSSSPCDALQGEARDSCLWSAAKEKGDPNACQPMSDAQVRGACADNVRLLVAVAAQDTTLCDGIQDAGYRTSCVEQIVPTTSENCAERGGDAATCDGMKKTEQAIAAGDPALCEQAGPDKDRCLDIVWETDADHDGLTALSESHYGTSPTNPDTDGDGFKDGDEVKAGYNPKGSGTL